MSNDLTQSFFEGTPSTMTETAGKATREGGNGFYDALQELTRFVDPEPHSLLNEPTYKADAAAVDGFHKVINLRYCPHRRAVVFTVFRPANPRSRSPKSEVHLAIPDFELAEMGYGIPGEWKWRNEVLNSGVGAADDLPDPFEDFTFNPFEDGVDPFAD